MLRILRRLSEVNSPIGLLAAEDACLWVPELGHCGDLRFLRGPLILVKKAAEGRSALDPHLGEVGGRVIG